MYVYFAVLYMLKFANKQKRADKFPLPLRQPAQRVVKPLQGDVRSERNKSMIRTLSKSWLDPSTLGSHSMISCLTVFDLLSSV